MTSGKTLAFHSYKGGTGKTTLVANLAATYAMMGMNIALLDFDLYAPSLAAYFHKVHKLYLNDFIAGEANMSEILVDVSAEQGLEGKLLVGFSNAEKEAIDKVEKYRSKQQLEVIKRFFSFKRELFSNHELDYLFLDTSPGIRDWSINAVGVSDFLFLLMKGSEIDIEGTNRMNEDVYNSLEKFGERKFIILNKVPGASPIHEFQENQNERTLWVNKIEKKLKTKVIGSIPCFCDIQFNKHEFLSAIKKPGHPFSTSIITLANNIKKNIIKMEQQKNEER